MPWPFRALQVRRYRNFSGPGPCGVSSTAAAARQAWFDMLGVNGGGHRREALVPHCRIRGRQAAPGTVQMHFGGPSSCAPCFFSVAAACWQGSEPETVELSGVGGQGWPAAGPAGFPAVGVDALDAAHLPSLGAITIGMVGACTLAPVSPYDTGACKHAPYTYFGGVTRPWVPAPSKIPKKISRSIRRQRTTLRARDRLWRCPVAERLRQTETPSLSVLVFSRRTRS